MSVIESFAILYLALGAGLATHAMLGIEEPGIMTAFRRWPHCVVKLALTALFWMPICVVAFLHRRDA